MSIEKINVASGPASDAKRRSIEVSFNIGSSLPEMVKLWGERIVFEHAHDNMVIALQGMVRSRLKKEGKDKVSDASIHAAVKNWKPGGRVVDPAKKLDRTTKQALALDIKGKRALMAKLQKELEASGPQLRKKVKPTESGPVVIEQPATVEDLITETNGNA